MLTTPLLMRTPLQHSPTQATTPGIIRILPHRDSVQSSHHESVRPATVSTPHDTPGAVPSEPTRPPTSPAAPTSSGDPTARDPPCPSDPPFPSHQATSHFPTSTLVGCQVLELDSASISHHTSNSTPADPPEHVPLPCGLFAQVATTNFQNANSDLFRPGYLLRHRSIHHGSYNGYYVFCCGHCSEGPSGGFLIHAHGCGSSYVRPCPLRPRSSNFETLPFRRKSSLCILPQTLNAWSHTLVLLTPPLAYPTRVTESPSSTAASRTCPTTVARCWMSGFRFDAATLHSPHRVLS